MSDLRSLRATRANAGTRTVKDVPFVELNGGRLQGVVPSGSDVERVYVSFFEAGTLSYNCSTNNNRPCGGLRGSPCKHLVDLLEEGVQQYGAPVVARYLKLPEDPDQFSSSSQILRHLRGGQSHTSSAEVFSRFLHDLRFVELSAGNGPAPELAWFAQ